MNHKDMKRILKNLWTCGLLAIALLASMPAVAQRVVAKTNLLYWGTGTPNLGLEVATGRKTSFSLHAGVQPWQYSDTKKLKHWLVQPEFRFWPCEVFMGHVIGIQALGGQFNAGGIDLPLGILPTLKDNRYQGWAVGAGLSYGYHLLLNRRWSMEFGLAVGYLYVDYKKYRCLQLSYMELEKGKFKEIVRFYVSDDANHIPVRLDMFLKFGSAKAFLVGYKGLRNPVTSIVK